MQDAVTLRRRTELPRFALLQKGFRPFFLLAALWAALAVPLWLVVLAGSVSVGSYLTPTYWHAHEMVFGFSLAVVAGFLLTAAGNWTKRETAVGPPLLALALLWLLGRAAMLASAVLPPVLVAGANLLFLPALGIAVGRVIVGAGSRRNYGFPIVIAALFSAQLAVHLDALGVAPGGQRIGTWVGVDLVVLLILLVGGRIIPLFTRNATGAQVKSVRWLDLSAIGAMALLALLDAAGTSGRAAAVVAGVTAVLAAARALRWGAGRSGREPLLWVLHVGYAWIPLGLALRALSDVVPEVAPTLGLHALTVGAIGTLTLGMMVRVALGHTGRALAAPRTMTVAFVLITLSALVRVLGPLGGISWYLPSLHAAGTLFCLAFALYAVRMGPVLVRARVDGRPG